MVSLCSTALAGGTCINRACRNRHDLIRCESCGCPLPLGSIGQHRQGKQHLWNVARLAANDISTSVESEPPTLPSEPPISQLAPPPGASSLVISASIGVPTSSYDPSFTVSHESGLDFEVEGTEIAGQHSFPPLGLNILIEETEVVSRLSIPTLKLFPAPGTPESWCGLFDSSMTQFEVFMYLAVLQCLYPGTSFCGTNHAESSYPFSRHMLAHSACAYKSTFRILPGSAGESLLCSASYAGMLPSQAAMSTVLILGSLLLETTEWMITQPSPQMKRMYFLMVRAPVSPSRTKTGWILALSNGGV